MDTRLQSETGPQPITPAGSDPPTTMEPVGVKPQGRKRPQAAIPKELRADVTQHARTIARKYPHLFAADRQLKDRVLRLMRATLPPRPRRRGRPGNQIVSRAVRLLRRFRRQHPEETPQQHWARVDRLVLPNPDSMMHADYEAAKFDLRRRVRWRMRKRRRKIPAQFAVS